MDLEKFLRYMKVLGISEHEKRTTKEIRARWGMLFEKVPSLRSVQGDMEYLSRSQGRRGPLIHEVGREGGPLKYYYLALPQVVSLFMTEEAAKELSVASQVYDRTLAPVRADPKIGLTEAVQRVLAESGIVARIRDCIRILPQGGVGRLDAKLLDESVRDAAVDALLKQRVFEFEYKVDHRNPKGRMERLQVSPLGIVYKDGQVYVVGVLGFGDEPKPYALHRMLNAVCRLEPSLRRPDFQLDDYIEKTHNFSFPLEAEATRVELRLRVHKAAIYHFRERKLTKQQTETPIGDDEEWFVVSAQVPVTTQLVPFLLSMGHWIEVLGPTEVRTEIAARVGGMWAHYAGDRKTATPHQPAAST